MQANEFARLAGSVVREWIDRHEGQFRCEAGRRGVCRYPRDDFHFEDCGYYRPLPSDIRVPLGPVGGCLGLDAGAQYDEEGFFYGYGDEYEYRSRGNSLQGRHQNDPRDHHRNAVHSQSTDDYDESHSNINASHSDPDFFDSEDLNSRDGSRVPSHRHPQTRPYTDDLISQYDSASEGSEGFDSSYLHIDDEYFSRGDHSRASTSGRPHGSTTMNRGLGSRPNSDHRHDGRHRFASSSATDFQDGEPRTRDPIDDRGGARVRIPTTGGRGESRGAVTWSRANRENSRPDFASGAGRGTGLGVARARGPHRGSRVPPNARQASHAANIRSSAVPASSYTDSVAGRIHRGQRNAALTGSTAAPRRRAHVHDTTSRSRDLAEDVFTVEMDRRFRSMRFEDSSS